MARTRRQIIKIDEERCNGCGLCIPSCKEGALQIVDGKAKLVGDVYCDGLGACLGECPRGALTIEEREADAFDEGACAAKLTEPQDNSEKLRCGCPGTMARVIERRGRSPKDSSPQTSELSQWPVQLALIPFNAPYLKNADLVLLADCTALAYPNVHADIIKGKVVAMACPKLDGTGPYVEKLANMIRSNDVKSTEVVMMEVPCCSNLSRIVKKAIERAGVGMPYKETTISIEGSRL